LLGSLWVTFLMAICGTSLGNRHRSSLGPVRVSQPHAPSHGQVCGIAAPLVYGMLRDWIGIEIVVAIAACLVLFTLPFTLALRPVVGWRATVT
jgi:hypothetical protein